MKARLLGVASREQLRAARRRYGTMIWNQLARLKTIDQRNALLIECGERGVARGLYARNTGPRMCASGCLQWAFYAMCQKGGAGPKKAREMWFQWRRKSGYDHYNGKFSKLKVFDEDAA